MRLFFLFLLICFVSTTHGQKAKIEITNSSVASKLLFINCSNELKISISNYKNGDRIKYELKGGKYLPGDTPSKLIVIPNDTLVELTIFKNNVLCDSRKFKAIKLAEPKITLFVNDTLYDPRKLYNAASVKTIMLKAETNEWTKSLLPNEVNYTVSEFKLHLVRGKRLLMDQVYIKNSVSITYQVGQNGDRYVIEVRKISRKNSLGETEVTTLDPSMFLNIPLN